MSSEEFDGLIIVPSFASELTALLGDLKRMSTKMATSFDKPSLLLEVFAGARALREYALNIEQLMIREGMDFETVAGLTKAATFMTDMRGDRGYVFAIDLPTIPNTPEEMFG